LIARFASYLPYRTAAQELDMVCGIRLPTSTIERYAQALEQRLKQEGAPWEHVREADELPASDLPPLQRPRRLHVTMDGVMAHIAGEWHEAKLDCVYQTKCGIRRLGKRATILGVGEVESGCKNVVQQRMKGLGMHWSQEGAEAQLHLCAHWKSAGVKDFHHYNAPKTAQ
jgi:hypothetical protein